jgi:hypothetical protein
MLSFTCITTVGLEGVLSPDADCSLVVLFLGSSSSTDLAPGVNNILCIRKKGRLENNENKNENSCNTFKNLNFALLKMIF